MWAVSVMADGGSALADAVRIVTGHGSVFHPLYVHSHRVGEDERQLYSHVYTWTTIELETFKPVVLESHNDDSTGLPMRERIIRRLQRISRSAPNAEGADDLRIVAIRKSDRMPDTPASRSWPRLGTYTRYTFEVEVSREPTKEEMESARMLFSASDFRFVPPKTFTFELTTEEMEKRLTSLLFTFATARQAIAVGRESAKQSKVKAAAEVTRVEEALSRMNASIAEEATLPFEEYLKLQFERAYERLSPEQKEKLEALKEHAQQEAEVAEQDQPPSEEAETPGQDEPPGARASD
jgi:hypothetical protein